MLATFPTFIGSTLEDENPDIYFEPEHLIKLRDPSPDAFREIKISSDTAGAMQQFGLFRGSMQQVSSVYPNTMGDPGQADVTATAIAGADSRSNIRNNYKSMTKENTFHNEFYWMILNMTWQFMHPKTARKLMTRDELLAFNPVGDYTYQPVTSNIELEYNKYKKVQQYDQTLGRLSGMVQALPELVPILAHIVGRQLELLGDEFQDVSDMIAKLGKAKPKQEGAIPNNQPPDMGGATAISNQNGAEMQPQEMAAREAAMPQGGMIQ